MIVTSSHRIAYLCHSHFPGCLTRVVSRGRYSTDHGGYHVPLTSRLGKVVLPEGWRDCRIPVWLVIPRHSDSVTQKKGFPVNPGLGAKADHPLSSTPPGRKAESSASQSLKQQLWPFGRRTSACYSQNAPGGNSCPELWMWLIVFSWLSHSRPAPSPLLIRTGSSESGWLASCRRGWEAELPPVIRGGH